ncbi:MAG: oxygen-independent coproporphyrinogen III oxidase [Candidatus Promineifilaceae bacterium]|nr:oxygen-independent coproporphyrinogen III oxidase [Candidatus Promineifilaceae bacterium]
MDTTQLLAKYDVPAPRYTSYPTVPYWTDSPTSEQWISALQQVFADNPRSEWSLYLHIPFCESLCTFCGCNTFITRNHQNEITYTEAIHREWQSYLELVPALKEAPLRQIHLGGGTPTFYAPENLRRLIQPLLDELTIDPSSFEGSIEVGPRSTTREQLAVLRELGFQRISMGVQDFNPEVQRLINRIQPYEMTRDLTMMAREMGFESVNYDLIYGLPAQTAESFQRTAETTMSLRPDRIALYSFAFVPWIKKAHRLFTEEDLPKGAEKRKLYELARETFLRAGYVELGLDHFSLPDDSLYRAYEAGELHRNFMGYTDQRTEVMIGLGVSSISEAPTCFHQNEKGLNEYKRRALAGEIPTLRGHLLNEEDRQQREQILQFMTRQEVLLHDEEQALDVQVYLDELIHDGLVTVEGRRMQLLEEGRPFLRNAAMALDLRLRREKPETRTFSQSV